MYRNCKWSKKGEDGKHHVLLPHGVGKALCGVSDLLELVGVDTGDYYPGKESTDCPKCVAVYYSKKEEVDMKFKIKLTIGGQSYIGDELEDTDEVVGCILDNAELHNNGDCVIELLYRKDGEWVTC